MCFSNKILAPNITTPNIIREKQLNSLSYKKCAHKMLVKSTPTREKGGAVVNQRKKANKGFFSKENSLQKNRTRRTF